jgi:hypothetical protein
MEHGKYMILSPAPIIYFALCVPDECNKDDIRSVIH